MLKVKTECADGRMSWFSDTRDDLKQAVQCLRSNFISYIGPFVIKSGIAVFRVSDYILTVDELVALYKSNQLSEKGLAKFAEDLRVAELQIHRERGGGKEPA